MLILRAYRQEMTPLTLTERTIEDLAQVANLTLEKGRARHLLPIFREFLGNLEKLDELDLVEEPFQLVLRVRRENDE